MQICLQILKDTDRKRVSIFEEVIILQFQKTPLRNCPELQLSTIYTLFVAIVYKNVTKYFRNRIEHIILEIELNTHLTCCPHRLHKSSNNVEYYRWRAFSSYRNTFVRVTNLLVSLQTSRFAGTYYL